MLVGSQVMEVAKKQQKELSKTKKELEKENRQQMELQQKLQEKEDDYFQIKTKFTSLQEELDFKTQKL